MLAPYIYIYFIEQYRHVLSTYFFICPFQLPNWFYAVQWELVDETPITNCYPSTFCLILGHHQGCVYCKRDVTFACTLLLCKCLLFMQVCCSILFISISSSSSLRHLSTLVLVSKLILLSLGCFILIWNTWRICNFCLLFCCSNIVMFSVRIFQNAVFGLEVFF